MGLSLITSIAMFSDPAKAYPEIVLILENRPETIEQNTETQPFLISYLLYPKQIVDTFLIPANAKPTKKKMRLKISN